MNLFTWNSPYYHLLKYLIFLLKHPVYAINNIWKSSRTNKSFRACLRTTIQIYMRDLAVMLHAFFTTVNSLSQRCTNSKRQVSRETTGAPKILGSPVWNLSNVTLSGLRILRWLLDLWKTVAPHMLSPIVVDSGVVETSCQERYPTQKDAIYAVVVVKIDRDVGPHSLFFLLPSMAVQGRPRQHCRLLWFGTGNNTKIKNNHVVS
jgi:hypothetical protein